MNDASTEWVRRNLEERVGGRSLESLESRLRELAATILRANERMNLTADRDPGLFWTRHIEDGLASAWAVQDAAGVARRILDVGSGAGLPGFVWAILWPEASVSLLEARAKRGEFLKQTAAALKLDIEVHVGRAETLAHQIGLRESFDLVAARALAALPSLLELTLPFARVGGHVAAIKSAAGAGEEVAHSARALELLGAAPEPMRIPYVRSDGKECEVILVHKIRPTPADYPRRDGMPQNKPLS